LAFSCEFFKLICSEGLRDSTSKTVINLSKIKLTATQLNVLERGLTFVPKPKISKTSILEAAHALGRKLKIRNFFRFKNHLRARPKFVNKSTWSPPDKSINTALLECINNFTSEIQTLELQPEKGNFSRLEHIAINQLKTNDNIVIKKADKGSATVIMDKVNYLAEGYRQLNNSANYTKLSEPIFPKTAIEINKILLDLKEIMLISEKQYQFLAPPSKPRPRYFYMLPKIHKPIDCWKINNMPPGRPIVSDCSSVSKNVAGFIDSFLKPFANKHPAYIKDTYDFVKRISNLSIPNDALLVTLDVESMYTNIDHALGIQSVKDIFPHCKAPFDSIIKLLELTLKNNDFLFDGKWFLQNVGTAMGVDYAPHFCDIFMAKFENGALAKCKLKPHTYLRFLDDVFIVWQHGYSEFQQFLSIFNSHSPPIKFKANLQVNSIDFLDTTVFKNEANNGHLLTKVYFKPTDTHQLLHKESFHPKHTFKGVVKSQITRFFRICSRQIDFEDAWSILCKSLRTRKYSRRWLREIKAETSRSLQIKTRKAATTNPGLSSSGSKPCGHPTCATCDIIIECSNVTKKNSNQTFGIIGKLDCSSRNIIYVVHCTFCAKQYIGETANPLRMRMNGHRSDINTKQATSALYCHLEWHLLETSNFHDCDINLDSYLVTPIEQIQKLGNTNLTRFAQIRQETYWIDTLDTLAPKGLNQKRECDISTKPSNEIEKMPFVIPFSRTAHTVGKIVQKHLKLLKENDFIGEHDFDIIMAYSKHKTIGNYLINSKT